MGWTRQEVLEVARSTGATVVEAWSDHDAGLMGTVVGPMLHHTGSTWSYPTYTAPTLKTVREGRSDLQNALCMYYIDYAGVIYCITEKIAWHAGAGLWAGITDGNGHYAGIEAESDGKQWTKPTVSSYKKLAAAILRKTGRTVAYAPLHKQYALPPGRKTDFSGMDSATFLSAVNADLAGTIPPTLELNMSVAIAVAPDKTCWINDGQKVWWSSDISEVSALAKMWGVPIVPMANAEIQKCIDFVSRRKAESDAATAAAVAKALPGPSLTADQVKALADGIAAEIAPKLSDATSLTEADMQKLLDDSEIDTVNLLAARLSKAA